MCILGTCYVCGGAGYTVSTIEAPETQGCDRCAGSGKVTMAPDDKDARLWVVEALDFLYDDTTLGEGTPELVTALRNRLEEEYLDSQLPSD